MTHAPAQVEATASGAAADGAASLRVLLVANYAADRQESMLRFAGMMREGLAQAGIAAELLAPQAVLGRFARNAHGLGKWLGYFDKFVLFPGQLRRAARAPGRAVMHICDHSNAPYVSHRGRLPCVVTCHDLGAVRGARGEPTWCPASPTGRLLQRWILESLGRAQFVACVSSATRADLARLLGNRTPSSEVVFPGLNQPFARRPAAEIAARLAATEPARDWSRPFLLHVGSNLARKNRDGVLRILHRLRESWDGGVVFAGARPTAEIEAQARALGLHDRVSFIERPATPLLEALYHRAFALLFPSRFEGFGWPVIEAQACGCPVLCSDAASLPEVAGDGALVRPTEDETGFAADVLRLTEPAFRAALVARGLANVARFDATRMIQRYVAIYREMLAVR